MNTSNAITFLSELANRNIPFDACFPTRFGLDKNVTVKKKDSSSPSRQLFSRIVYKNLKGQKGMFPVSIKIFPDDSNDENILGLKYEKKIYAKIIDTIIAKNYSPNFVAYVGYACCNAFGEMSGPAKLTLKEYEHKFPSLKRGNYCVLITEQVGNGIYFGYKQMLPVNTLIDFYTTLQEKEFWSILFQVVYSIEVMQRFRIVHNDLHAGNILVMTLPKPVSMAFFVEGKTYKITTQYIPYIFDWDFGFAEEFGPNPKLETKGAMQEDIRNRFNRKGDLYTLICTLKLLNKFDAISDDIEVGAEISMNRDQYEKIIKFRPLFKNGRNEKVYKFSRGQLLEIFGQYANTLNYSLLIPKKRMKNNGTISYTAKLYKSFPCRPTAMSNRFPTPLEWIQKYCSFLQIKDPRELTDIPELFKYRLPPSEKHQIYIDPFYQAQGRDKLEMILKEYGMKPRFPPQKSGYVKTKGSRDEDEQKDGK